MGKNGKAALMVALGLMFPLMSQARGLAESMNGLHAVLDQLYDEMMPLCGQLIGVAQGIAGFAATWYIATRVWRHIANAEPIDFYPLFRPFVLGFCIMVFPSVLDLINGVMKPAVTGTAAMVEGSNKAMAVLLDRRDKALLESDAYLMYVGVNGAGNRDHWYRYTHGNADPAGEGVLESIGNDVKFAMARTSFAFSYTVKAFLSEILRIVYEAAALCIDTIRTFQLIVLAILGPFVFGLAVFDGFQQSLTSWLARYINVFLWLPVANILGAIIAKIQEKMVEMDIAQLNAHGDTFFNRTDAGYLVFMIIGIVAYFTVPTVAGYIVNAGGAGAMVSKFTSTMTGMAKAPYSATTAIIDAKKNFDDGKKYDAGTGIIGAIGRSMGKGQSDGGYQHSKLSGRHDT